MGVYLSPGTYVEEIELGPRPIEGVPTSIGGTVGVTERGPEGVPVLITSFPGYQRIFGSYLDPVRFTNTWYLPHSVEGFFQNLGQTVFVVRAVAAAATRAQVLLMGRGRPIDYASRLIGAVQRGAAFLIVADATGLVGQETLRLDDGTDTEYVQLAAGPFPALLNRMITLRDPASTTYGNGTNVTRLPGIAAAGGAGAYNGLLAAPASAGGNRITVDTLPAGTGFQANQLLRIGAGPATEYAVIAQTPSNPLDRNLTLRWGLARSHPVATTAVVRMVEGAPGAVQPLSQELGQGGSLLILGAVGPIAPDDAVRIGGPVALDPNSSFYQVADFRPLQVEWPLAQAHAPVEQVSVLTFAPAAPPATTLAADTAAGDTFILVADRTGLNPGDWLQVGPPSTEFAQITTAIPATPGNRLNLRQPLRFAHTAADPVRHQAEADDVHITTLLQAVAPGASDLLLADNSAAWQAVFVPGAWIGIGDPNGPREYTRVGAVLAPRLLPLGAASRARLGHDPEAPTELRATAAALPRPDIFTLQALDRGGWGNELRVRVEDEDPPLAQTTAPVFSGPFGNVTVGSTSGLEAGSLVEFIDVGTTLAADAAAGDELLHLASRAGLNIGDILRVGRAYPEFVTIAAPFPAAPNDVNLVATLHRPHTMREAVDRMSPTGLPLLGKVAAVVDSTTVRFDGAGLAFAVLPGWTLRSREFKLNVDWIKRGTNPGTRERLVESETHRFLSLDDRHSRYIGKIVGSVNGPIRLWDRRPDGQSNLVRVDDPLASPDPTQTEATNRLGPDLIYQVLAGGRRQPVGRWLSGGDDAAAGIADADYVGLDNVDPLLRTGLHSLRSIEEISLVAIPGRTSQFLQEELIVHCEQLRYRFALLDSVPGTAVTGAQLPDVQHQRQQYDTKYAALYYPWLQIEDPFPANPALATNLIAPPSLHMMGTYARIDVTRGVHKAPANEVIAGILGLQRSISKGEQDLLNPHPMNVNVLRDFREQLRGMRVYGARVITSDDEWKYVNVRRLFNYIERSLDVGTQPYVMEPNDQHLWARVRRSIGAFLTQVWRSGGLMGSKPEEAYFVKCDATTMTLLDQQEGRLIVVVGIAPVFPAEFVIIRIGQWQGGSSIEEL